MTQIHGEVAATIREDDSPCRAVSATLLREGWPRMSVDERENASLPQPSPERFEAVIASISDGVFTVDTSWRISCFNRAAEQITGYRRSEVMGRFCFDVLRSDLCRDACPVRYTVETGTPVTGLVVYITDKSDNKVPVSVSTAVFRNKRGELIGGVETFRDLRQIEDLKKQIKKSYSSEDIVSKSPRMRRVIEMLPTVAESQSTILLSGESGTGKELFARAIHNLSGRKDYPFVAVNCASFPETLIESELFGYERGAFTGAERSKPGRFARAEKGTLFLDEVGDLPPSTQAKLLRVLQEKTYEPLGGSRTLRTNARIVAAADRDLASMVAQGTFRRALYYRIRVIELSLPPLRERLEDVLPLVRHFIERLSNLHDKPIEGLTPEALHILMNHDYPGNVRELENIVEHGFVLSGGPLIGLEHLPEWLVKLREREAPAQTLEDCERRVIRSVLDSHGWNRLAAARALGVHKSTLFRKLHRLGIHPPKTDGRSLPGRRRQRK
jgi:PAS domain S-box-containing protein